MALKLDPGNPNHARLLALKEDNRDLINALDDLDARISMLHVVDVKLGMLIDRVCSGPARVAFETEFEAVMHDELEAALRSARRDAPSPPQLPATLADRFEVEGVPV